MRRLPWRVTTGCVLAAWACLCLTGCDQGATPAAGKIVIRSGDEQVGPLGSELPAPLSVEVLSPVRKGLLGGKGSRHPVVGAPVTFRVINPSCAATLTGPAQVRADPGGVASVGLKLGPDFGNAYVEAFVETPKGRISVTFRARSGIRMYGSGQEVEAGQPLPLPFVVEVVGPDGPLRDVPVFFHFVGESHKAKLSHEATRTDVSGRAETLLTTGPKSGTYLVAAEVADPDGRVTVRGLTFQAGGINRTSLIVMLLGGLAIFMLGIRLMSEGLQRVAGKRLRSILQFFTRNRFVGVLVGTAVTGAIQSSSACTVMVIGFVNAGLLTLKQAIGVIYGANIGTTVTAQMISFKLNALAYPAIVIGLAMQMIFKRRAVKFWGQTLLGFGLLFLGMTLMGDTLAPLKKSAWFRSFFMGFDCAPGPGGVMPLLTVFKALLIGTAFTLLVQSSSATVGLTMALAGSGLINFYTAVPIILGDNIGTTITAVLASLAANRVAKQAAAAHSLFNLFGALYMVLLLYVRVDGVPVFLWVVERITAGTALVLTNPENIERHIAMAHSVFNVVNVIVFIPLVGPLVALCGRILPTRAADEEVTLQYLEPHLLDTPAIALEQAINEVAYMATQARKAITKSFQAFLDASTANGDRLRKREEAIDELQTQITEYLIGLSQRDLTEGEARALPMLIHSVNDAERIGDHGENLLELTELRVEHNLRFSPEAQNELTRMHDLVQGQFADVIQALEERDPVAADRALKAEARINDVAGQLAQNHVARLERGDCDVRSGVVFLDLVANLEKVGDHLTNIAQRTQSAIYVRENGHG